MASNNSIVFQNFLFYISCVLLRLVFFIPYRRLLDGRRLFVILLCHHIIFLTLFYMEYTKSIPKTTTTTAHIEGRTNGFATDDGNFLFSSGIKFSVELSIQCWGCCSLIWELFECAQSTQTALFAHISTNSRQLLHISAWSLCMQCALSVVRRFSIIILSSCLCLSRSVFVRGQDSPTNGCERTRKLLSW